MFSTYKNPALVELRLMEKRVGMRGIYNGYGARYCVHHPVPLMDNGKRKRKLEYYPMADIILSVQTRWHIEKELGIAPEDSGAYAFLENKLGFRPSALKPLHPFEIRQTYFMSKVIFVPELMDYSKLPKPRHKKLTPLEMSCRKVSDTRWRLVPRLNVEKDGEYVEIYGKPSDYDGLGFGLYALMNFQLEQKVPINFAYVDFLKRYHQAFRKWIAPIELEWELQNPGLKFNDQMDPNYSGLPWDSIQNYPKDRNEINDKWCEPVYI